MCLRPDLLEAGHELGMGIATIFSGVGAFGVPFTGRYKKIHSLEKRPPLRVGASFHFDLNHLRSLLIMC